MEAGSVDPITPSTDAAIATDGEFLFLPDIKDVAMTWTDLLWLSLFSMIGTFSGMAVGVAVVFIVSLINDHIYEDSERKRERWDVRNN